MDELRQQLERWQARRLISPEQAAGILADAAGGPAESGAGGRAGGAGASRALPGLLRQAWQQHRGAAGRAARLYRLRARVVPGGVVPPARRRAGVPPGPDRHGRGDRGALARARAAGARRRLPARAVVAPGDGGLIRRARGRGSCAPLPAGAQLPRSRLLDQPDAVALRVEQHRDSRGLRDRRRRLHDLATEPLDVLQALLEPLDPRVERDVLADLAAGRVDAAGDAALGAGVDHAVALRVVGVDLPAEQATVEARERVEVAELTRPSPTATRSRRFTLSKITAKANLSNPRLRGCMRRPGRAPSGLPSLAVPAYARITPSRIALRRSLWGYRCGGFCSRSPRCCWPHRCSP